MSPILGFPCDMLREYLQSLCQLYHKSKITQLVGLKGLK